jgi:hypothetical protein
MSGGPPPLGPASDVAHASLSTTQIALLALVALVVFLVTARLMRRSPS